MIDRNDLDDLWELMPGIRPCKVFVRLADSELSSAVDVAASEKRPIDERTLAMIGDSESELDYCTFHLWVSTFSRSVEVRKHCLIQEASGKRWVVLKSKLEMSDTRYRCDCVELPV